MENIESKTAGSLEERIERLDRLIETREDGARGLGVRLALGLAQEIREALTPGTLTGEMVAHWVVKFGTQTVDEAVSQARVLLMDPARMASEFRKRLEPVAPATTETDDSEDDEESDCDDA